MVRKITKKIISIVKNNVLHRDTPVQRKRYQYAEENKQKTLPVSAFFLIDSLDAIEKCKEKLAILKRYNMPNIEDLSFFEKVYEIYEAEKEELHFIKVFKLRWGNEEYPARLRLSFLDKGRYEIELWIPGVIANDAQDMLGDGYNGFFCGFMPPAFYSR